MFQIAKMMDELIAKGVIALLQKETEYSCSHGCYAYQDNVKSDLKFCESLFVYAVHNGHYDIVKRLIKHGVDVNVKGKTNRLFRDKKSVLHIAVEEKHVKIVKLLLEHGANADEFVKIYREETLLHIAAENGSKEIVELLLDFGANPNRECVNNWDPVCGAASEGHAEIVKLLLDRGAECEVEKAMCLGAESGSKEIVTLMCERGVSPTSTMGEYDDPALFRAAERGCTEVVELLLTLGADIDDRNSFGKTGLHAALESASIDTVHFLLKHGANFHLTDVNGVTSLHYAASRPYGDDSSFMELMLDLGLDINAADSNGSTPLHNAADSNCEKIVKYLLSRGADINKKDTTGNTAVSKIAEDKDSLPIAKILVMHIAQLQANNLKVSNKNLAAIRRNVTLNGFFIQCKKEIESMKSKTFDDSLLTIDDVFNTVDESQYVAFARNKNIADVINSEDFASKYPIYGESVIERLQKATLKNQSLDQVKVFFLKLATRSDDRLPKLPLNCLVEIFNYLSGEDVTNLSSLL